VRTPIEQDEVIFEDQFDDQVLSWTTVENQDFWEETNAKLYCSPSTSAGDAGNNYLYADETVDGSKGRLEWPFAIEVKGFARDTSAVLGAWAASGGPKDGTGNTRLGVTDGAYTGGDRGDTFSVFNSAGQRYDIGTSRQNNRWYTYRLVPDLDENVIRVSRNGQSWTVPEPGTAPIGDTSLVISGVTCWGCGGNGDRQYEYIRVENIAGPTDGEPGGEDSIDAPTRIVEQEPNDTQSRANPVGFEPGTQTEIDGIMDPTETDWFKFSAQEGTDIVIELSMHHKRRVAELELVGPDGTTVGVGGHRIGIITLPQTGTYYLSLFVEDDVYLSGDLKYKIMMEAR
jgi:hypothetical protein